MAVVSQVFSAAATDGAPFALHPLEVPNAVEALPPASDAAAGPEQLETPKRTRPPAPRWEMDGKERLKKAIRHLAKPLAEAVSRDANEADTRLLVTDLLRDGLGYHEYGDLATEYRVRGEYADYGIRIDKQLTAFVEVKRATTKLGPKHLRQIELYAVNEGVEWLILTNSIDWQVYHLSPGMPVTIDLAFKINLLDEALPIGQKVAKLFYIHHESLKRRQIDELWRLQAATSPKRLAEALLSAPVLLALRREVWRRSKQKVEDKELTHLLRDSVIRPDALA